MSDSPKPIPLAAANGPVKIDALPWASWGEGDRFGSRVQCLADSRKGAQIGVIIEELPPGKQSCPFHYHLLEEEHVMVLEGVVTLRLGDKTFEMSAGDYIRFPAGEALGHCLINNGDKPCKYLCFGPRNPNEVAVYPDSDKVMVRGLGEIYQKSATLQYWDGEN